MAYWLVGLTPRRRIASRIHPMGLRGRRAASRVPTATAGTTTAAVLSPSATGPPGPVRCVRLSSGTTARSRPSVSTPNATATTGAARQTVKILLTMLPGRGDRTEPTLRAERSGTVTASRRQRVPGAVTESRSRRRAFAVRLPRVATIVAFHAHPDDEVLLTGGTIAWLAAEGHRVMIVVACDGEVWPDQHRGQRLEELRASAAILGADKAVHLGYADSGHGPVLFEDPPGGIRFARADIEEAAGKLAGLLTDEHADLLLSYDPHGGYGHRDHVRVHQVGARAAQLAGARGVEATVAR